MASWTIDGELVESPGIPSFLGGGSTSSVMTATTLDPGEHTIGVGAGSDTFHQVQIVVIMGIDNGEDCVTFVEEE